MIEIQCPNCERTLKVPEKYVGTEGACNYCGGRVQVQAKTFQPAAPAPSPITVESPPLQAELAEARAEIQRLSEAAETERRARERAEAERDAALARAAELDAAVAQAAERERNSSPRAELEKIQADLAESKEFAQWLGRELEAEREKSRRAEARLRDVRTKLSTVVNDLADAETGTQAQADADEEAGPRADFTPADAAAILVGNSSGSRKGRWAWVVGVAIGLLAVATGIGIWGLAH